jgi:nucleoid DNA-binding protein
MATKKSSANKSKVQSTATKRRQGKTIGVATKTPPKADKKPTTIKTIKAATAKSPLSKISKAYTKSVLLSTLADRTCLARKEVNNVLSQLSAIIAAHLKKGGPGMFMLPGLLKLVVKQVPAKKARAGINPFTGEQTTFKAKPASRKVKIKALKSLKEMAA